MIVSALVGRIHRIPAVTDVLTAEKLCRNLPDHLTWFRNILVRDGCKVASKKWVGGGSTVRLPGWKAHVVSWGCTFLALSALLYEPKAFAIMCKW